MLSKDSACSTAREPAGYAWLTSAAEPSSGPKFSPHGQWANVSVSVVQETLRLAFGRWGCPQALRVDNGYPWGATGGLPTGLSLWSAGLGVPLYYNPPRCPQRNGVVESTQGTSQRWAEPKRCRDVAELRRRVGEEDQVQRAEYPAVAGCSRLQAYPALLHSGRGYCRGWEEMVWDLAAALAYLEGRCVVRKVGQQGKVSVYDRMVSVGRQWAGEQLTLRFAAAHQEWVFSTAEGVEVRRRPALGLTQEAIVNLRATGRPTPAPRTGVTADDDNGA
jgi:hypothetical protein